MPKGPVNESPHSFRLGSPYVTALDLLALYLVARLHGGGVLFVCRLPGVQRPSKSWRRRQAD